MLVVLDDLLEILEPLFLHSLELNFAVLYMTKHFLFGEKWFGTKGSMWRNGIISQDQIDFWNS